MELENLGEIFKINCRDCFGFCCTALYFSKVDGFPKDKEAGKPCLNLDNEFKCKVHSELSKKGLNKKLIDLTELDSEGLNPLDLNLVRNSVNKVLSFKYTYGKLIEEGMKINSISKENRDKVNRVIISNWYSTDMVVRGHIYDMTKLNGYVWMEEDEILGLITFNIENDECEIVSLDSTRENIGIGSSLLNEVIKLATLKKLKKIKLITTNDNINAIRFYQKRRFDMVYIYRNALNIARSIKPSIPLIGDYNIPLKHEIEFELYID